MSLLEDEVIWGHIDILVVVRNSTSGPQPYQPYEGGDYHLPYFQQEVSWGKKVLRREVVEFLI